MSTKENTPAPSVADFDDLIKVPVKVGSQTITCMVTVGDLDFDTFEAINDAGATPAVRALNTIKAIVSMVHSWDLTEADRVTPVPITEARLRKMKMRAILTPIANEIFAKLNPTAEEPGS